MADRSDGPAAPEGAASGKRRRVSQKKALDSIASLSYMRQKAEVEEKIKAITATLKEHPELIPHVQAVLDAKLKKAVVQSTPLPRGVRTVGDVPDKHLPGLLASMSGLSESYFLDLARPKETMFALWIWATGGSLQSPLPELRMLLHDVREWAINRHVEVGRPLSSLNSTSRIADWSTRLGCYKLLPPTAGEACTQVEHQASGVKKTLVEPIMWSEIPSVWEITGNHIESSATLTNDNGKQFLLSKLFSEQVKGGDSSIGQMTRGMNSQRQARIESSPRNKNPPAAASPTKFGADPRGLEGESQPPQLQGALPEGLLFQQERQEQQAELRAGQGQPIGQTEAAASQCQSVAAAVAEIAAAMGKASGGQASAMATAMKAVEAGHRSQPSEDDDPPPGTGIPEVPLPALGGGQC